MQRTSRTEETIAEFDQAIQTKLLPWLDLISERPYDPIIVKRYPPTWKLLGAGNYAAVFAHPDYRGVVVKVYAPNRPGLEDEVEVYRRIGRMAAYSECLFTGSRYLILKQLEGITFWNAVQAGIRIPRKSIEDIERGLNFAKAKGLNPCNLHGKNVMISTSGQGLIVDVSDFLKDGQCQDWKALKLIYYLVYRPFISPLRLRIPLRFLDWIRKLYRLKSRLKSSK